MRVKFHGGLRDLVPLGIEEIDFDTRNVRECVEALSAQLPSLHRKKVQIVGVRTDHDLLREDMETVHMMPAFVGGKRGGLFQIVVGSILIAASIAFPGLGTIAGVSLNSILFNVGLSLVLAGIMSFLAPKPPSVSGEGVEGSKYLGARGNTTRIGTRVPIGYGRHQVYGHILSFNVTGADAEGTGGGTGSEVQQSLSLSQGNVSMSAEGVDAHATLNEGQNGEAPLTYSATHLGPDLTFDAATRRLTAAANRNAGRIITYTVTDDSGESSSVEVPVRYNTLASP